MAVHVVLCTVSPAKNSGAIAIGLGITALVLAVGAVCCCKYKKTCCFKQDDQMEGGLKEDKTIYKKEVKSKNSHKRHAKETLVPTFQVDQA